MTGKTIRNIRERADERLRRLCGRITPDARVVIIVTMLLLFGGLSVYMTVSSIYHIGKEDGRLEFGRIERLRLKNDSIINPFKQE